MIVGLHFNTPPYVDSEGLSHYVFLAIHDIDARFKSF